MFGIRSEIEDDSLYMLHDMIEDQVLDAKKELLKLNEENHERIRLLTDQIRYYEYSLEKFKADIEKKRSQKFQFSVEELYAMFGQYEHKYISIEFHKFSESALKYGRNIGGVLVYSKNERENLERIISEGEIQRTNGMVKIDCSSDEELDEIKKYELLQNGFISGDIYEVLSSKWPAIKSYNQKGLKEIPYTVQVNLDANDFDPNRAYIGICYRRIENGYFLIEDEWNKFCGISLCLDSDFEKSELMNQHGFNEYGQKKSSVRFYELRTKLYERTI